MIFTSTAFPNSYLQRWRNRILESPKDRATKSVGRRVINEPLGSLMTFLHFPQNRSLCMIIQTEELPWSLRQHPVVQHPVFIFYSA